jgi:hypothetical protein
MKGQVTDEGDNDIIQMLVQELELKYAQNFEMGYVGMDVHVYINISIGAYRSCNSECDVYAYIM